MNLERRARRKSLLGTHSNRNKEFLQPNVFGRITRLRSQKSVISPVLDDSFAENETIINDNTILSATNSDITNNKLLESISNTGENDDNKNEILLILNSLIEKKMATIVDLKLQIEDLKKIKVLIAEKCEINQEQSKPVNKNLSPNAPSLSQQIMKEMQSTLKIFKTPRLNRKARESIILTPGSMTSDIQRQCKELFK